MENNSFNEALSTTELTQSMFTTASVIDAECDGSLIIEAHNSELKIACSFADFEVNLDKVGDEIRGFLRADGQQFDLIIKNNADLNWLAEFIGQQFEEPFDGFDMEKFTTHVLPRIHNGN